MRVHKEHRIQVPQSRFFELVFDPNFTKRLNMEAMHTENYEVLERNVEGDTWTMRARVTPKDNMPGFLKKLIGSSFSYEEHITHKKGSDSATAIMTPSALKDKAKMSYTLRVVPDGDNACKRIMDWDIEIKIFAVGGQIEKFAMGEVEKGVEASASFYNTDTKKA